MTAFGASSEVASDESREASHHFTVGMNLVLFGWLIWTVAAGSVRGRAGTSCMWQWGPLVLYTLGACFAMLDPIRHVLLDHNGVFMDPHRLAMFRDDGTLSTIGKFCQVSTIAGVSTMISAMLWYLDAPSKVYRRMVG